MHKIRQVLFSVLILCFVTVPVHGDNMKEDTIALPVPDIKGSVVVEAAISKRRSVRGFSSRDLTLSQISQLLWAVQGITDKKGYRSAPSAGALYPLEVYLVKKDGLYKYIPDGHKIKRILSKDLRGPLQSAAFFQSSVKAAAVDIVICAVYERVTSRYGNRGIRYTDIEVGHAAQNVHLQAVALGLDSVPIGAFNDNAVSKLLQLPDNEIPLYIIPVGYKQ
jgi:SagB-type dehydrogenase family enzyme